MLSKFVCVKKKESKAKKILGAVGIIGALAAAVVGCKVWNTSKKKAKNTQIDDEDSENYEEMMCSEDEETMVDAIEEVYEEDVDQEDEDEQVLLNQEEQEALKLN